MIETAAAANTGTVAAAGDVVARGSRGYRIKWFIMGAAMVAYGWWSLYDGYVKWPRDNQQAVADAKAQGKPVPEKLPHDDWGILLNKLIGISLQPLGMLVLFWAFYSSRGAYRLAGDVLSVPGHPPVPFGAIRAIDQSDWDRKGIARIEYEVDGKAGKLKLDDYIYEREPTDQIYDRILAAVAPAEAEATITSDTTAGSA
jgi:hypothetical protein